MLCRVKGPPLEAANSVWCHVFYFPSPFPRLVLIFVLIPAAAGVFVLFLKDVYREKKKSFI